MSGLLARYLKKKYYFNAPRAFLIRFMASTNFTFAAAYESLIELGSPNESPLTVAT